jgi:hypothetical protein
MNRLVPVLRLVGLVCLAFVFRPVAYASPETDDPVGVGLSMVFDDQWVNTGIAGVRAHRDTSATLSTVMLRHFEVESSAADRVDAWIETVRQGFEGSGFTGVEVAEVQRSDGLEVRRVVGHGPIPTSPEPGWTILYGVFGDDWFASITVHAPRVGAGGFATFDGPARSALPNPDADWRDAFAFRFDVPGALQLRMRSAGVATFGFDSESDGLDEIELLLVDPGPPESDLHDSVAEAEGLILSLRMHQPSEPIDTWDVELPGVMAAGASVRAVDTQAHRPVELRAWSIATDSERAWVTLVCVPIQCEQVVPELTEAVRRFRWTARP